MAQKKKPNIQYVSEYDFPVRMPYPKEMPWYFKMLLTLDEASKYSGIGINRMRSICKENPKLTLWVGNRRLVKRKELEKYLLNEYSV